MLSHLRSVGIVGEAVNAVFPEGNSPWSHRYDNDRRVREVGYPLRRGEVGCFLSHIDAWERVAGMAGGCALVLEDDAELLPGSVDQLGQAATLMEGLPLVARLVTVPCRPGRPWRTLAGGGSLVRTCRPTYLTVAYLITPEAARKLLANAVSFWTPVDAYMSQEWHHGCRMLAFRPEIALHADEGASTIGARPKVAMSWTARVRREWQRTKEFLLGLAEERKARAELGLD